MPLRLRFISARNAQCTARRGKDGWSENEGPGNKEPQKQDRKMEDKVFSG